MNSRGVLGLLVLALFASTLAIPEVVSAAGSFTDDDNSTFEADIEWLAAEGVTKGCNPPTNDRYCPDDFVTRGQMAAFLRRALDQDGDPGTTTTTSSSSSSSTSSSTTTTSTTTTTTTTTPPPGDAKWIEIDDGTGPQKRHEAGFVAVGDRLYLIGGRGVKYIQYFDLSTGSWVNTGVQTADLHHFQPVVLGDDIYIVGALTGKCCEAETELPVDVVKVFDTQTNTLSDSHAIPPEFQRGSTGAVAYQGDIYIVSGNSGGHGDTTGEKTVNTKAFTKYDPDAPPNAPLDAPWTALETIPHARDHFSAAVIGDKLYVAGGRTSEVAFGNAMFAAVVPEVDVYDFDTDKWSTLGSNLPSPRAASPTAALGGALYVIGGEGGSLSSPEDPAWDAVHRLVPSNAWAILEPIPVPRHGTGAAVCGGDIYVAAGATTRGGEDETNDFHALDTAGDDLDCLNP
ncbi:MAG TPA: kelch repeat-containing protein [Acidimicrobiia bacterium]|nr:kelch repeat-containing protein [Acidimicrobiia bacterium]